METCAYPISAVRLIIPNEYGRILILRRTGTQHSAGSWCLPGGKVDYGDTVEGAAQRELKEETGLNCVHAEFLFYQDSLPLEPGGMHCINFYILCATEGNVVLNDESDEIAWIGRDDLARYKLVFRNDEGLERYWKDSLARGQEKS